jgi:hypothetical protein
LLPDDAQDDGGSRSTDGNDNRESITATLDRQTGFAGTQRYQTPGFSQPGPSYQNPGSQQPGTSGKARQTDHSQLAQSGNNPQGPHRPELNISSDLDIDTQLYAIEDPEFCDTLIISSVSLLTPGAIQKISQVIASAPKQKRHPFPVLIRYFAAKAKDFRFVCADLLHHRELIQAGEPPVFLHNDHPKLMYIIQMKYRAAKKRYRKYRDEAGSDDEMDINIIKHHMSDVRKFYESALPQLDMLAAHHNL